MLPRHDFGAETFYLSLPLQAGESLMSAVLQWLHQSQPLALTLPARNIALPQIATLCCLLSGCSAAWCCAALLSVVPCVCSRQEAGACKNLRCNHFQTSTFGRSPPQYRILSRSPHLWTRIHADCRACIQVLLGHVLPGWRT